MVSECRVGYRPPIMVGDSPPYEFHAEFPTFYDTIFIGSWTLDVRKAFVVIKIPPHLNTLREAEWNYRGLHLHRL